MDTPNFISRLATNYCARLVLLVLLAACNSDDPGTAAGGGSADNAGNEGEGASGGEDGGPGDGTMADAGEEPILGAKIFEVDLQVDTFDTSDPEVPQLESASVMLFGTFPLDPEAVEYHAEWDYPVAPHLSKSGSWKPGEPVPETFANGGAFIPGWEDGVVGGEYFLILTATGCQSGTSGSCEVGSEWAATIESNQRDVRSASTLTITIEYE